MRPWNLAEMNYAYIKDHAYEVAVLPCGHYSTGVTPFKYADAAALIAFLRRGL